MGCDSPRFMLVCAPSHCASQSDIRDDSIRREGFLTMSLASKSYLHKLTAFLTGLLILLNSKSELLF